MLTRQKLNLNSTGPTIGFQAQLTSWSEGQILEMEDEEDEEEEVEEEENI